jgi:hypothetical protein
LQRSTTVLETAGEEILRGKTKILNIFRGQMQTSIIFVFLFSSGAVIGGSDNIARLTEFIADVYQHFPHRCFFIISSEAQQGED